MKWFWKLKTLLASLLLRPTYIIQTKQKNRRNRMNRKKKKRLANLLLVVGIGGCPSGPVLVIDLIEGYSLER